MLNERLAPVELSRELHRSEGAWSGSCCCGSLAEGNGAIERCARSGTAAALQEALPSSGDVPGFAGDSCGNGCGEGFRGGLEGADMDVEVIGAMVRGCEMARTLSILTRASSSAACGGEQMKRPVTLTEEAGLHHS